jgi:DNA polymerase III alpha subunit
MMFVRLEDLTGAVEVVVFPRLLRLSGPYLSSGAPVIVDGWTDLSDDGHRTVVAEKILPLPVKQCHGNQEKPWGGQNPYGHHRPLGFATEEVQPPAAMPVQ